MYASIIGTLGFLLALYLAYLEYQRRRLRMTMWIQAHYIKQDNKDFVFLYVGLYNPADIGKTVGGIEYVSPHGLALENTIPIIVDQTTGEIAIFSQDRSKKINLCWELESIMSTPLDIPPHSSRVKWVPVVVVELDKEKVEDPVELEIFAKDPLGKRLCGCKKILEKRILE